MPPRSIWNGAVAFGAVTVPIKVFGALEDRSIRFRELHAKDGSEVAHLLVDNDGAEIPRERVAKGYEVAPDEYVVMTNDEIKAADQPRAQGDRARGLRPRRADRPGLLRQAVPPRPAEGRRGRVRAARRGAREDRARRHRPRPLRQREQLVSVRPVDGVLRMQVMRFADELVPGDDMDVDEPSKAPAKKEVDMAGHAHRHARRRLRPDQVRGHVPRARARGRQAARRQGEEIELPEPEKREESDDLMAALEASLKASKKGGS